MDLRLAKVIQVHPESSRVDIIMLDDGSEVPGVTAMCSLASTRTGVTDLPTPSRAGESDLEFSEELDMIAVVGTMAGGLLVLGFLHPSATQMLFKDGDRMVYRHASDVYFTVDAKGNTELFHPSGSYFRIGETSDHEDLTGTDFEEKWKIDRNTDTSPYCKLAVAVGGVEKVGMELTPAGHFNLTVTGNVVQNIDGDVTQAIGGAVSANIIGNATVTSPHTTVNGKVTTSDGNVVLDDGTFAIVTTGHTCAFTGQPHIAGSSSCKAKL